MQSECHHRISCANAEVCGVLARRKNVNIPQYFAVFFSKLTNIAIFNSFIVFTLTQIIKNIFYLII